MEKNDKFLKKPKNKIKNEYYEMKPALIKQFNLRFIEPYEFKYQLYIKGRWVGKKLIDVLKNEFKQYDEEYFIKTIHDGKLKINNTIVEPDYILKRNDFMSHLVIRKENPIIDQKLEIVFENDDYLVVDKPSSWPVHVCGGYQFNTLQRILLDEFGYKSTDLKILHRLDKHTSGIVIFAKNKLSAEVFRKKLHSEDVGKTYLCRVKGDFSPDILNVKRSIIYVDRAKGVYTDVEDKGEVKEYYAVDTDKEGFNRGRKYDKSGCKIKNKKSNNLLPKENDVDDESKSDDEKNEPKYAETNFEKLFYDPSSNTSVVIAKPITGRTHQIRIHLRYAGFPIANDPCYGGVVFNDLKEFKDPDMLKFIHFLPEKNETDNENININNNNLNNEDKTEGEIKILSVSEIYCYKIWLHAWKYKFNDNIFETKFPVWAEKDYELNHKF